LSKWISKWPPWIASTETIVLYSKSKGTLFNLCHHILKRYGGKTDIEEQTESNR